MDLGVGSLPTSSMPRSTSCLTPLSCGSWRSIAGLCTRVRFICPFMSFFCITCLTPPVRQRTVVVAADVEFLFAALHVLPSHNPPLAHALP